MNHNVNMEVVDSVCTGPQEAHPAFLPGTRSWPSLGWITRQVVSNHAPHIYDSCAISLLKRPDSIIPPWFNPRPGYIRVESFNQVCTHSLVEKQNVLDIAHHLPIVALRLDQYCARSASKTHCECVHQLSWLVSVSVHYELVRMSHPRTSWLGILSCCWSSTSTNCCDADSPSKLNSFHAVCLETNL